MITVKVLGKISAVNELGLVMSVYFITSFIIYLSFSYYKLGNSDN